MKTTDQVAGEAREKLADRIEIAVFAQRLQGEDSITLTASFLQWKEVIAALRAQPERGVEEMPNGELRHYPDRVGIAGDMGVIDRQFGFVRCILPYDYKYTSNSQQWDEAARICRALEGPMSAQGIATIRALPLHPDKDEGGGR